MANTVTTPSTTATSTGAQPLAAARPARYLVDASHTHAGFSVRHLMISNVRGEFGKLEGEVSYDPAAPAATSIRATIDVASINTRDDKRDAHLRSADFFDVERFPTMTFVSSAARPTADGLEVSGELTIAGVSRPLVLTVEDITAEGKDPWGNQRIGATAHARIKRSDYGMTWNAALEAGGVLVGDEVKIQLEVELIRQA